MGLVEGLAEKISEMLLNSTQSVLSLSREKSLLRGDPLTEPVCQGSGSYRSQSQEGIPATSEAILVRGASSFVKSTRAMIAR